MLSKVMSEMSSASAVVVDEFDSPHVCLCAVVVMLISDKVFKGDMVVTQCLVNGLPGCDLFIGSLSGVLCHAFGYV